MRTPCSPVVVLGALVSLGCQGPQDYLRGAGPAADRLAWLGGFALVVVSATCVVMWLLLGWLAVRKRGTFDEHAPVEDEGGQRWIVFGGVAIPIAVLAVLLGMTLFVGARFPMARGHGASPEIRLTGQQWWFDARYLAASAEECGKEPTERDPDTAVSVPTELHVPVGIPIDVELVSRDVIHSFWVPKLHGKVDMIPGQSNHVRIEATRPGTFAGECGEFCGVEHARMRVEVVAQTPLEFDRWLAAQRLPAAEPISEQERLGRAVFERSGCLLCHQIRGTAAHGNVGPDLTHVASRHRIAGGALENDTANLAAWITHAQSLKPGCQMPDLTRFSGEELLALVAYLQRLR
ncbi:MAG TPA: c-type cytochrome [Polyangiaceae bacterium]|jgi:cytochrome c oxidase subunit 2|nr:c-type cytochrome [Polyangiaceae bacterium]